MQRLSLTNSRPHMRPPSGEPSEVPSNSANLYGVLQQEVDLGVQALQRESADMAVTLFQSAIQKLTIDQPLYDHLVHNLLLSYKLLIEKLLKEETSTVLEFLRAALRLEIRGNMAEDPTFLRKFAGAFQNLGVICFQNNLYDASLS